MVVSPGRRAVRAAGRAARQAVAGDERVEREAALVAHLASVPVLQSGPVGVFVAHDGEPDLTAFVTQLWDRNQVVALPVLHEDPADHSMFYRSWSRGMVLEPGRYDIPVPAGVESMPVAPSCVLVSLTAFDALGNRIGRGGGFFDRYLASTDVQIVGVGFETQRVARVPVESHDVSMPIMVTDLGVRYLS